MAEPAIFADLALAARVQSSLLPKPLCRIAGWQVAFSYQPALGVSGDYVDIVEAGQDAFHFILGDVSGKGVSAALLMASLHATIRVLLSSGMNLDEVVRETSSRFCDGSLPAQFATLVIGTARRSGEVELINAGHTPVLLVRAESTEVIAATGVPIGLFCEIEAPFLSTSHVFMTQPGETLFLYSDGITESAGADGSEYSIERLQSVLFVNRAQPLRNLIVSVLDDLRAFTDASALEDDRSVLTLRFLGSSPQ